MPTLHPIFAREIDAFDRNFPNLSMIVSIGEERDKIDVQEAVKSFLLAALQRASMSVVEEAVGEEVLYPKSDEEFENGGAVGYNALRSQTLSKGREIIGIKENEK